MGPFRQNEDWLCPDPSCGNNNFARRTECNKCGVAKPFDKSTFKQQCHEIGDTMAEKSKGLFSAEDWQCSQCGNVNWARRNTCNVCMSPKNKTIENRTGFGGGFMERERKVEYKDRNVDDSNNEYDEFGRKKRKFRKESTDDCEGEGQDYGLDPANQADISSHATHTEPVEKDDEEEEVKEMKAEKKEEKQAVEEEDDDDDEDDDSDADLSKYAFSDDSDSEPAPKVEALLVTGSKRSSNPSTGDRRDRRSTP